MSERPKKIIVFDKMQKGYEYVLVEPLGKNFHKGFEPELTPKEMLRLGVLCGKYMTDCMDEFPDDWFEDAKLADDKRDCLLNYYGVDASLSLREWEKRGWIYGEDPRGWFQWYCRYFMGRRMQDDERQIKRWRQMKRHVAQVKKNCEPYDLDCRKKQRQALLHWAYDSRKI